MKVVAGDGIKCIDEPILIEFNWIKTSDELPPEEKDVLLCDLESVFIGFRDKDQWRIYFEVTFPLEEFPYWMELPALPNWK